MTEKARSELRDLIKVNLPIGKEVATAYKNPTISTEIG